MFRIAICDDNSNFISQVKEMLMHWGQTTDEFHLSTFDNGDSLINAHLEAPFDIILLDVLMPFTSGIHVAKELRNNDKSVKIVFLTSSPEYAIDSYSVKASNYLLKPLDEGKLYRCLEELFEEIAKDTQHFMPYIKHRLKRLNIWKHKINMFFSGLPISKPSNRWNLYMNMKPN